MKRVFAISAIIPISSIWSKNGALVTHAVTNKLEKNA